MEQSNKPGATGLTRVINAFGYSMKGLRDAFIHEAAFRQELLLCVVLLPLALWLGQGGIEQALLIGSLFLVLIVELVNSAIEAIVDRVGSEMHELSGRAKDIGSAAVLLALLNLFVVWALLLYDRFI
jgi:diacylglycerol kinase (ATP)